MTRYLLYITLLITLGTCIRNEKNKNLLAKSVEVFYDDDWTTESTTHISKNGIIRFGICDTVTQHEKILYYRDTLDNLVIDSINYYLHLIKNEKIDSIYDFQCYDCGLLIVTINYTDTTFNTKIIGINHFNNNISRLAKYMLSVTPKKESPSDSCFNFLLKKYITPFPPGIFDKYFDNN